MIIQRLGTFPEQQKQLSPVCLTADAIRKRLWWLSNPQHTLPP